jgi:hypothetical protein
MGWRKPSPNSSSEQSQQYLLGGMLQVVLFLVAHNFILTSLPTKNYDHVSLSSSSKPQMPETKWFQEFKNSLPPLPEKTVTITGCTSAVA